MDKVLHSSKKQDWQTPVEVLDLVREVHPIGLDPCASSYKKSHFAAVNFTKEDDGLSRRWCEYLDDDDQVFINPPYGPAVMDWALAFRENMAADGNATFLGAARTDTRWFRLLWDCSYAFCFWSGRIKFCGAESGATFPSVLFYSGYHPHRFCDVFQDHGIVGVL